MNDSNHKPSVMNHELPEDLKRCISFHGHLCPGLVYGYLVAKEAIQLLGVHRSQDEEVVASSANATCAVDALQVVLGTSVGKGNLIIKDYGKNAFTVLNRTDKRAFRFSRKGYYQYEGEHQEEFNRLEAAFAAGDATTKQQVRHKLLKSLDLLSKPFDAVFNTKAVKISEPPYAPLARSEACAQCGEMTMSTRMVDAGDGRRLCVPCAESRS